MKMDKQQTSYLMDAVKRIDLKMFIERESGASLAPKGRNNWMGICPIHKDSDPSFSVSRSSSGTWWYNCFGCQSKGTIIDFCIDRFDLCNAWDATVFIANKEGIKCDSSLILKAAQEAKIQTDRQYEIDIAHFVASENCRLLLKECRGEEKTMLWVARSYAMMNKMLDDGTATARTDTAEPSRFSR